MNMPAPPAPPRGGSWDDCPVVIQYAPTQTAQKHTVFVVCQLKYGMLFTETEHDALVARVWRCVRRESSPPQKKQKEA